jgi:hypothetical protein
MACGDDDPPTAAGLVPLTSGAAVTGLSAPNSRQKFFQIAVPVGSTRLTVSTSGGTGNVDLFVQKDRVPRFGTGECESLALDNTESCTFEAPRPGVYYIVLFASVEYRDVTLTATVARPG